MTGVGQGDPWRQGEANPQELVSTFVQTSWVWVKNKPPGTGPQVLVLSIYPVLGTCF